VGHSGRSAFGILGWVMEGWLMFRQSIKSLGSKPKACTVKPKDDLSDSLVCSDKLQHITSRHSYNTL